MANWHVLMEMSLSSTGVKDDADVAKDAIFSKRCLLRRGLELGTGRYYRLDFLLSRKGE